MRKPKVAVIGGGIFGVSSAIELAKFCHVDLFEKNQNLLAGATFANHNRHHFGFHYPRSEETARQCLEGHSSFCEYFASALFWDFSNYYCVGKEGSKVSPEAYLAFCQKMGLEYRIELPSDRYINPAKIELALRVKEAVCDIKLLQELAITRVRATKDVQIFLDSEIRHAVMGSNGTKILEVWDGKTSREESYDCVINASYAHYNRFCGWMGFTKRAFQFNLQELCLIRLPGSLKLGMTVMDGAFPSFLPFGNSDLHIAAHVEVSQLVRETSFQDTSLFSRIPHIVTNWEGFLQVSKELFPILSEAQYVRSILVDRVVDSTQSASDARISEITEHGQSCYSIFAAKVVTCVATARKIATRVRSDLCV
ncbi:MAG: FAD-dependent oxidoreductase [Oligoflexales bacterium]|nr:FAD-dependent oxidoreductase [Oligoflexales bacterium]